MRLEPSAQFKQPRSHRTPPAVWPQTHESLNDITICASVDETGSTGARMRSTKVDWVAVALWTFVLVSFAGLFFCLYVIHEQCRVP